MTYQIRTWTVEVTRALASEDTCLIAGIFARERDAHALADAYRATSISDPGCWFESHRIKMVNENDIASIIHAEPQIVVNVRETVSYIPEHTLNAMRVVGLPVMVVCAVQNQIQKQGG